MRILLIGSGGRESALAWKISQSPLLERLVVAPGNPGTEALGENVSISISDLDGLVDLASEMEADLVVVGPETPLVNGLADRLFSKGIPVFGPRAEAAELEGSKAWCKELLERHRIPTPSCRIFSELNSALSYLDGGAAFPLVIKASGLAAGKGVVICPDASAAAEAVRRMLETMDFGDAGATILAEEFLSGPEASAFALTDSRTLVPLETCQDHKALLEGNKGPNTGGMGAVSPNPKVGERMRDNIERQVLLPTLHGMNHEGRPFHGVLFAGLILTVAGPKVLEYNVRFGDPECQVLMMRMKSDVLPLLLAAAKGDLDECEAPEWDPRPCVTVILASEGYPSAYTTGLPIEGLDSLETGSDLQVFHCGTELENGQLVTAGGRVLAVTAMGEDIAEARSLAYAAVDKIDFQGKVFRRDIGKVAEEAVGALP